MNVVYASDENYFPYIYIGIETLLMSNSQYPELRIHYIYQNVKPESLDLLDNLGKKFNKNIEMIPFQMPAVYDELPSYKGSGSKTTYAKFMFASMFPNADKVLFLDPDTIVLGDISDVFSIDMGHDLVAGVIECLPIYHKEASKMTKDEEYINGGMLLCNLKEWRSINFENQALIRLADTSNELNYDQGIINELCRGKIKYLPPKYNAIAEIFAFKSAAKIKKRYGFTNYYTQKEVEEGYMNPKIIHFTEFTYNKPMSVYCTHPYAKYFQQLLEESPLSVKLNHNKTEKQRLIRQWMLDNTPFGVYLAFERILDIRRKWLLNHPKFRGIQ